MSSGGLPPGFKIPRKPVAAPAAPAPAAHATVAHVPAPVEVGRGAGAGAAAPNLSSANRRRAAASHERSEKYNSERARYHDLQICGSTFDGLATSLTYLINSEAGGFAAAVAQLNRCLEGRGRAAAAAVGWRAPGVAPSAADIRHEEVIKLVRNLRDFLLHPKIVDKPHITIQYGSLDGRHGFNILSKTTPLGYVTDKHYAIRSEGGKRKTRRHRRGKSRRHN